MWLFGTGEVDIGISWDEGRWSYGRFQDDNNIFYKMINDLTTRTWQDDIWCPIIIILFCTSDECWRRKRIWRGVLQGDQNIWRDARWRPFSANLSLDLQLWYARTLWLTSQTCVERQCLVVSCRLACMFCELLLVDLQGKHQRGLHSLWPTMSARVFWSTK
jgi:hypothetical protein